MSNDSVELDCKVFLESLAVKIASKNHVGERATIGQVALKAGVSKSCVSSVFNNGRHASDAVKKRVFEIAESLGYRPHYAAQSLAKKRSGAIGVLIRTFDDYYSPLYLSAISEACEAKGYTMVPAVVSDDVEEIRKVLYVFSNGQADGVLVLTSNVPDKLVLEFAKTGYPINAPGRYIPRNEGLCSIKLDIGGAFLRLLEYLYGLGHREFGFIAGFPSEVKERYEQFYQFMADKRLEFSPECERMGVETLEKAEYEAGELLKQSPGITALVCSNDVLAWGALAAARDLGLTVPVDLSITGFDDLPISRYSSPKLTTVHMPIAKMAMVELENLVSQIECKEAKGAVSFVPELVIRETSAAPRSGVEK